MSKQIKVNAEAIEGIVEKARQVPEQRMDEAIDKLKTLSETLSTWEGEAPQGHAELYKEVHFALIKTKMLMSTILKTLDQSVESLAEQDDELGESMKGNVTRENVMDSLLEE
ncbi:hypothetical protein MM221_10465 [Salipaludibacillus sp. LMS25]|jgi:uncharacterized protein YukE|uniref:WXG100 family type VII secretion target n=1 Tax=Salipaludibacillus sp. LMS25 TaxID=2924031 RepID=UPI0020D0A369|nr:hypothetical protein [Salipaludibacillus sp. LMS25]UTR16891.1 hypothetical protein MM221_10465 [Salipaludibacillus sp. LMS25]